MVDVTLLLYLVLFNSMGQSGNAVEQHVTCGKYVEEGADVIESNGVVMTIYQQLMPDDLQLVPGLKYQVTVSSLNTTDTVMGFSMWSVDDVTDAGPETNTSCQLDDVDVISLPIIQNWTSPVDVGACVTVRLGISYNSTARQVFSSTLCKPTGCFNYLDTETGVLASPNFPSAYPDNANCSYYVIVGDGETIDLQFQYLSLEQPYASRCFDSLEVYHGNTSSGPFCGLWTRHDLKKLRFKVKESIRIRFVSDNKLNSEGFRAVYQTLAVKDCSQTLYNLSGIITSQSYPDNYFPNSKCRTTIILPSNYRILLKLVDLHLEPSHGGQCVFDKLHVFDDKMNTSGATWCNELGDYNQFELRYESSASVVVVDFESDNLNENKGFLITYLGVPSCQNESFIEGNGSLSSVNYPSWYPNGQECFYTISVGESNKNIELTFQALDTESDSDIRSRNHLCNKDYVEVYDGRDSHRVCGNWTGEEHLLLFRSVGDSMVFKFVSDERTTRPGFYANWRSVSQEEQCVSTWLDTGSTCFEIIYQKQTWNDSDIDCRSRGGHLAIITDQDTELLLSNHLKSNACIDVNSAFWIGANDQVYESDFYWTDGSKVTFTDWFGGWSQYGGANHQPSDDGLAKEDCVELRRTFTFPYKGQGTTDNFRWNDRNCKVKNAYVCQCYKNGNKPEPKATPAKCNKILTLDGGDTNVTVTSPGYPGNYPDFMDCRVTIIAPKGQQLVVDFNDLNLEPSNTCEYDFLTISPFPNTSFFEINTTRLCGNWTRKAKLLRTLVPGNVVFLHFSSDHSFRYPGFSATVTVLNATSTCGEDLPMTETSCLRTTHPASADQAEDMCNSSDSMHFLQEPSLPAISMATAHTQKNEMWYWYSRDGDRCRAVVVMLSETSSYWSIPTDVTLHDVSCNDTYIALCHRNITGTFPNQNITNINEKTGHISTKNYPQNYVDNIQQTWRFHTNNMSRILFTLRDLELEYQDECLYDFLEFKETTPEGRYCGFSNSSRHFLSRDNHADVYLETDFDVAGQGFFLSWMALDMSQCANNEVFESEGSITSFNFPFAFPDKLHCVTRFLACLSCRVYMEINVLSIPEGDGNYLKVDLGENQTLTYTSSTSFHLPLTLLSVMSNLTLVFHADYLPADFGFKGTFKHLKPPVILPTRVVRVNHQSPEYITSPNSPLPYPSAISQKTIFRAPIGYKLKMNFDSVNLEPSRNCASDTIDIKDTSIRQSEQIVTTLCCDMSNRTNITTAAVVSIYNRLELTFVSAEEYTNTKRGYSAKVEAAPDPTYINQTATLGNKSFDSCMEQPCVNGGKCVQKSEDEAFCQCPGYFTGLFCQVTHCQLSPCVHGVCMLTSVSYSCNCSQGYWGPHCHLNNLGCRSVFCGGKGICNGNSTATPACKCDSFWEGSDCRKPMADSRMTLAIGQRLLGEPIWIGLIVILSVLLAFGVFYVFRRKFGKHFTCCDINFKKDEKIESKGMSSEMTTPQILQASFSMKKAKRCSIPPPLQPPPIISITKAEDSCVPSTPSYNSRTGDVAARFFASYKEAEKTPIAAPVAVDFTKTTATSMASDSDDDSIVGGLVGGTLAFAGTRLRNEEIRRSEANKLLRASSHLQAPSPTFNRRDKMKRSHSTGPYLVRQASLYDDLALTPKSEQSSEHLFPNIIVSNETNIDDDENSSIQIYLDETEDRPESSMSGLRQMSRSDGSLRRKVSSWSSIAIDDCQSHYDLSRRERANHMARSASVDQLKDPYHGPCTSKSKSHVNSFESGVSCSCSRCKRYQYAEEDYQARSRSSSYRHRKDPFNHSCSCESDRKYRHTRRRHHKIHRKLASCDIHKGMNRGSSTESEQLSKMSHSAHRRSRSSASRRSFNKENLDVHDSRRIDKDEESGRKDLFRKFFSQDLQHSTGNRSKEAEEELVFRFPQTEDDRTEHDVKNASKPEKAEATCSVIIYNCPAQDSSRQVSIYNNAEASIGQEDQEDSAISSSGTSSDSFKQKNGKPLEASCSLLTVTDTDSAMSSAPKSFQVSPYHLSDLAPQTGTLHMQVMKKDSAYQTKQSSVDVTHTHDKIEGPPRKLSLPTTRSEESNVTQRLHQAACKLFLLQQRVRRNRFSKDSAVHTISEDEWHNCDHDEEGSTDLFRRRRMFSGSSIPLRHLEPKGSGRHSTPHYGVQLKSTSTPVSDTDPGEIGEVAV